MSDIEKITPYSSYINYLKVIFTFNALTNV